MLPQSIPRVQTTDKNINQLQQNILSVLNQIVQNPIVSGTILKNVVLQIGSNTISHGLGRVLQGWSLVRLRANANIYDTQDLNTTPALTLLLTSDAVVTVDLMVF